MAGRRKPMSEETRRKIGKKVAEAAALKHEIARLCGELDAFVEQAEALPPKDERRKKLMRLAEAKRQELRRIDH